MKLILMGPSGAGKGTQSEILKNRLGIPVISTGYILREEVKNRTEIGIEAGAYMDAGKLVPDQIIIDMVAARLAKPDCKNGYILDGVPRTIAQAEALEAAGIIFDAVLVIKIEDSEIEARISGRRTCTNCGATYHVTAAPPKKEGKCDTCGGTLILRSDDSLETVKRRLRIYHERTSPLQDFYRSRGVVKIVENQPTIEATTTIVMKALGL